jgi:hypothetical protein
MSFNPGMKSASVLGSHDAAPCYALSMFIVSDEEAETLLRAGPCIAHPSLFVNGCSEYCHSDDAAKRGMHTL